MRKKSTRLLSAALAACMMLSVLPVGAFAAEPGAEEPENGVSAQAEEDAVAIDATNFPDGAFRQYVADNFDKDKDGALNQTERNAVKEIRISNSGCTSLQGLKYFSKLTDLFCSDNNLTELDVSENPELKRLICYNNSLTSLNLNKNTKLESLNCNKNKLTVLDLRENKSLWWLRCNNNCLTSLDLRNNPKIRDLQVGSQRYQILANDDRTYDLHQLPGKFELDGVTTGSWKGGTVDPATWILKANSTTVTYDYEVDDDGFEFSVTLNVHWHNYKWNHDGTKHWRECTTANCPGLTAEQVAKTTHDYTDAKDNDCNTCGYVRPLYTVTTVNATAKLESEAEELKAPVAAGTEVTLTAADASEGKTFAGWKLYNVSDTESEITDETELAKLLKNGIATTATLTLTMPAYDVKAEPYYSNIPYNITPVNCTVDKTEAAKGDTVTATRREPEANERFIDWTVKVNGVKQPDDFLTPDAIDPAKVRFTMPAENVEIKANFEGNPTLNIGDHVTANIEGNDASVPSGSAVPVGETVHLTAIAPEGQHFTGWTVKVNGVEQDPTFLKPDADDPTKVTFTMPDANVEVTATFAEDPIPEPDPVGPSDTGNIQGAISAVVVGAAAGVIAYEAGTGIYRVINMPGIPMPSNRIELAELLWEHAGKPEPVSTALYSDIDEGDTDAQKAARWAVEQDLMKDDADNNKFHPAFPVSKLRTCLTWNAAKEKGLSALCVTDHYDMDFPVRPEEPDVDFDLDLDSYYRIYHALSEKLVPEFDLRVGVELGVMPSTTKKLNTFVQAHPELDFIICSLHVVDGMDPYYPEYFEGKDDLTAYRHYFETLLACVKEFDNFNVCGHLDYIVRYGKTKADLFDIRNYADIFEELFQILVARGQGIEINTGSLYRGLSFPHPHTDILKMYKDAGGEIITVGSDAHHAEHIGYGFDVARELLLSHGFRYYTTFKERKPEFHKIP